MDIFFQDPNEIPLPPEEVRIRDLQIEVHPDGKRVRTYLELDPFQKRPCAELVITNSQGEPIATTSVIESMTRKIEITMHLRAPDPHVSYTLSAMIYYQELPGAADEDVVQTQPMKPEPLVVDQRSIVFTTGPSAC
jgi:hypothetical protein